MLKEIAAQRSLTLAAQKVKELLLESIQDTHNKNARLSVPPRQDVEGNTCFGFAIEFFKIIVHLI